MAQRRPNRQSDTRARDIPVPAIPLPPLLPVATPTLLIGFGGICVAAAFAFSATFRAGMISWDDPDYIRDNLHIHFPDTATNMGEPDWSGLGRLWNPDTTTPIKLQQYYPLVFSTVWLEYFVHYHAVTQYDEKGEPKPSGVPQPNRLDKLYTLVHVDNFILHLINVLLVIWLMRRMGLSEWVALATAAIFAIHPTQVASVLWMSERKNTLSGMFYLLSFIFYLRHRRAMEANPTAAENRPLMVVQGLIYGVTGLTWIVLKLVDMKSAVNVTGLLIPVTLATIVVLAPLATMLYYVPRSKGWGAYLGCMACFMLAMFSKTQTLTLFLTLLLVDWLLQKRRRLTVLSIGAIGLRLLPMIVAGVIMSSVTKRIENGNGPSGKPDQIVYQPDKQAVISTPEQRPLIAATTAWFYVGKFLAPIYLAPVYPKWRVNVDDFIWYLPMLGWAVAGALALIFRKKLGGYVLFGLASFVVVMAPPLGLAAFNYQQYSYVADHFLYLACIYGGMVLAILAERLAGEVVTARRVAVAAVGIALLGAAAAKSHEESKYWTDIETFWKRANSLNPDCYPGHLNLGNQYLRTGRFAEAIPLYYRCCELHPGGLTHFQRLVSAIENADPAKAPQALVDKITPLLEDMPGFGYARLVRAHAYERLRRAAEACDDFRYVYQTTPQGSPTWNDARDSMVRLKCQ